MNERLATASALRLPMLWKLVQVEYEPITYLIAGGCFTSYHWTIKSSYLNYYMIGDMEIFYKKMRYLFAYLLNTTI